MQFFTSPTGNIQCLAGSEGVRCDVRVRQWAHVPNKPSSCVHDWGVSLWVAVEGRQGALLCVGDAVESPDAITLECGESLDYGGLYRCDSTDTGMTCRVLASAHGFLASRERFQVF